MNWTGGRRSKIRSLQDQSRQREYFDRQRRLLQQQNVQRDGYPPAVELAASQRQYNASGHFSTSSRFSSPDPPSTLSAQRDARTKPGTVQYERMTFSSEDYQKARELCIEMLGSSFNWVGEPFLLRPPPPKITYCNKLAVESETGRNSDSLLPFHFHPERSSDLSEAEAQDSDGDDSSDAVQQDDHRDQDNRLSIKGQEIHKQRRQVENQADGEDEEEEDEALLVPARHIAICYAARALRRSKASAPLTDAVNRLQMQATDNQGVPRDKPDVEQLTDVGGCQNEVSDDCKGHTLDTVFLGDCDSLPDEEPSPVISVPTPIFAQTPQGALSMEWIPGNQEAAIRLQLLDEVIQSSELDSESYLNGFASQVLEHQEEMSVERLGLVNPWPILFSPIQLPSDPEDTSVLELASASIEMTAQGTLPRVAIEKREEEEEHEWRAVCSSSDWLLSEDWLDIAETEKDLD
ncbi:hypothetical protein EDD11_005482 [Mortierella claussenii]|nr:hypothetical protein EDD11_005482 [Mortierella claussenii]